MAAFAAAACHQLAGLEEPTAAGSSRSDAANDAFADATDAAKRACRTPSGGACFCEAIPNPAEAPVVACVDFDEDGIDPQTFGLGPGLAENLAGPLTLALDQDRPLSAPRAFRVDVKAAAGIGIRERSILLKDTAPTDVTIQFSTAFDKLDAGAYDAATPNRTILLLLLELAPDAPRGVVFGVDYRHYALSVVENLQAPETSQVQEAGVTIPGSIVGPDNGYTTFVLSVENRSDCPLDGVPIAGLTAVLRGPSEDPAAPGTQLACRPLGATAVGTSTRLYIGGYIKNPIEPLEWRFDNIVVRKRRR